MELSNILSVLGNVVLSGINNMMETAKNSKVEATIAIEEIEHGAGALGMQSLLGNTEILSAKEIKEFQQAIGPFPTSVCFNDIATLPRKNNTTGEKLILEQKKRFLRNRLSSSKIQNPYKFETPAATGVTSNPITVTEVYKQSVFNSS